MSIRSIGIIGLGSFGRFALSIIAPHLETEILGYDTLANETIPGVTLAPLKEVARTDVVILAIPLSAYPEILSRLQILLPSTTLLVDICSVKLKPEQMIEQLLPDHSNLILTHPLFGPQSATNGVEGHKLIVTRSIGLKADEAIVFCEQQLGLEIFTLSAQSHDEYMAKIQSLTFFLARGLNIMNLEEVPFIVPSFQMLLDLVQFDKVHSEDLFQTIEQGNPNAKRIRSDLIQTLEKIHRSLSNQEKRRKVYGENK